jgi:hypothetical protein
MNTNNIKDFTERLEKMLLFQLTLNIKSGKLTPTDAQKITLEYLSLKPKSKEEILQGLINIGYKYDVVQPVIAKFSEEFDEEFKDQVLSKMHEKMGQGDIDSAIKAGKQKGPVHA